MDSSAFDAIKTSAMSLVSQKYETQREVDRLSVDVHTVKDEINECADAINIAFHAGCQAFDTWQALARKRTAVQDNALMLLNKATTMWQLAQNPPGRDDPAKENSPCGGQNNTAESNIATVSIVDLVRQMSDFAPFQPVEVHCDKDGLQTALQVKVDAQEQLKIQLDETKEQVAELRRLEQASSAVEADVSKLQQAVSQAQHTAQKLDTKRATLQQEKAAAEAKVATVVEATAQALKDFQKHVDALNIPELEAKLAAATTKLQAQQAQLEQLAEKLQLDTKAAQELKEKATTIKADNVKVRAQINSMRLTKEREAQRRLAEAQTKKKKLDKQCAARLKTAQGAVEQQRKLLHDQEEKMAANKKDILALEAQHKHLEEECAKLAEQTAATDGADTAESLGQELADIQAQVERLKTAAPKPVRQSKVKASAQKLVKLRRALKKPQSALDDVEQQLKDKQAELAQLVAQ